MRILICLAADIVKCWIMDAATDPAGDLTYYMVYVLYDIPKIKKNKFRDIYGTETFG